MSTWQPIETAPKDGTKICLTWMEGGNPQEQWIMQWDHGRINALIPGITGFWVTPCGSITWVANGEGAPTHWRPAHAFNN